MGYPPQPHDPYQQQPHDPYQQQPPYGQPGQQAGYGQQPYPPQYGQPQQQQPVRVQQVGRSVTKPAWTVGDILWIIFTGGLAWPVIWMKRRSRTTITRHR